jgi:hypothetical protein
MSEDTPQHPREITLELIFRQGQRILGELFAHPLGFASNKFRVGWRRMANPLPPISDTQQIDIIDIIQLASAAGNALTQCRRSSVDLQ